MEKSVFGMAAEIIDDKMYFSCQYDNALYVYDLVTGELHFKKYFFQERKLPTLYYKAYVYKRSIFFIPWEASKIAIYDGDTSDISYIEKPVGMTKTETVRMGNAVYLMPIEGTSIFLLDLENRCVNKFPLDGEEKIIDYKHRRFASVNNEIICLPGKGNVLYGINVESGWINTHKMPFNVDYFSIQVMWGNKKVYVPAYLEKGLIIYDTNLNKYNIVNIEKRAENVCCVASVLIKDDLLLLPVYGHTAYVINLSTNSVTPIELRESDSELPSDLGFQNVIRNKNTFYAVSDRAPILLEINADDPHKIKLVRVKYENKDTKLRIRDIVDYGAEAIETADKFEVMYEGNYELEDLFLRIYQ